jgi:hypothetical protein
VATIVARSAAQPPPFNSIDEIARIAGEVTDWLG